MGVDSKMMIHDVRGIESIPSVVDKHFRFDDTFLNEFLNLLDFLNVPVMPVVKCVVVIMEIIGIKLPDFLSSLIGFIGLT